MTLTVKVAWWLRWYLLGVAYMCVLTGLRPDEAKLAYWTRKAIKVEVL